MCVNMSITDRILRLILGTTLVAISPIAFNFFGSSITGWIFFTLGVANLIAVITGWCFMYALVGINVNATDDSDDDPNLRFETHESIKTRMLIGFGAVTLLVASLYVIEGYSSAVNTSSRMELHLLAEKSSHIINEMEARLDEKPTSSIDEALQATLGHYGDEVIVGIEHQGAVRWQTANPFNQQTHKLINHLSTKIKQYKSFESSLEHQHLTSDYIRHTHHHEGSSFQLNTDFGLYNLAVNRLQDSKMNLIVLEQSHSSDVVISEVLLRLLITSVVVIWLGLWAAYAVATFVWTRVQRSNRSIMKAATTDTVTGLTNQRKLKDIFIDEIEPTLTKHKEQSYRVSAVRFRNFHHIAANYGTSEANNLLAILGQNLQQAFKSDSYLARLDDGNIILITDANDQQSRQQFRDIVNTVQYVDGYAFSLEPTEVAINYPADVSDFDGLIKVISLMIMNANKTQTRFMQFNNDAVQGYTAQLGYASQIKDALTNKEFELYLQPKIDLTNGKVIGAEALARWNHPTEGLLTPFHFLDVIESSNARSEFSKCVGQQTIEIMGNLIESGFDISLSFNLSGYDLTDDDVCDHLICLFNERGITPKQLEIEVLERETAVNINDISTSLQRLSDAGYSIALDDFGTGMSSLSYCKNLPIDTIKIDRTFVTELSQEAESQNVVKTIMFIAERFGYNVVAEGIETEEMLKGLLNLNCSTGQGYFFAKPLPVDQFIDYIRATNQPAQANSQYQ